MIDFLYCHLLAFAVGANLLVFVVFILDNIFGEKK